MVAKARKAERGPRAAFVVSARPDVEGAAEMARRARARRDIARVKADQARVEGPSVSVLKSDPDALRAALKRRQVARISKPGKANPKSRDTDHVFTADGTRYARTDLYRPTIKDRVGSVKRRVTYGSLDWWDKHKKQIVVAAIATTAGFMIYGAWKNAQLQKQLAMRSRALPKSLVPSHPAARTPASAHVGWGLPPPVSYGWHGAPAPMWALAGYDYPFVAGVAAPSTPVVTKGHFAGSPRALYRAVDAGHHIRSHHSHLVGAPGEDYSFTRRPGYNDKNY
jgi:hypothetical protein